MDSTLLRNPLGTRDLTGNELLIRDTIIEVATKCFQQYGGIKIDTPIMECFTAVTNLYGNEFNKLVYKLADDHEQLFLRYDLTLPLARYINMNGLKQFRRYQIGKVYRKDNPQISKGRFREFWQCDFDIIGDDQGTGLYQYEILDLFDYMLLKLLNNTFTIRFNDRRFLVELLFNLHVPESMIASVCSTLDKLDKKDISEIQLELQQKGIDEIVINSIIHVYGEVSKLSENDKISYFTDMGLVSINLIDDIKHLNMSTRLKFDPFLVRGMDYYTGLIFEANYNDHNIISSSIGGGGTYNKMISSISQTVDKQDIFAVGLSIGIERIATILEKINQKSTKQANFQIYVATIGKNMVHERFKLTSELRRSGYSVTMSHLANPKMKAQFDNVFENNIPLMLVLGDNEITSGTIKVKDINKSIETTFERSKLHEYLKKYFY